MNITTKLLRSLNACQDGIYLVATYEDKEAGAVIRRLVADNKWNWANWLIARLMSYKQYVSYAVFASLQVIDIFEKKHPGDNRPRKAIEAAKKCIDDPSEENKKAAAKAAKAAKKAPWAAWAAAEAKAWAAAKAAAWAVEAKADAVAARESANTDIAAQIIDKGLELLQQYPNPNAT